MGFKVLSSSRTPTVEEMRQKMKETNTVHADPLRAESSVTVGNNKNEEGKKKGRKSVKIYTAHFSTYLSTEQENALYNWCEENGVTPSVAIRMAVAKLLSEKLYC